MPIDISGVTNKAYQKAVNYGNNYLNEKLNYGLNYAQNFLRHYDVLGLMPERWTLLDETGEKAFDFDAFISAEVKSENKVSQMPVEEGSFASYNLTSSPITVKCVLARQGTPEYLADFAEALITYAQGIDLLSIITPEREYENMKLVTVNFGRAASSGVDIIYAECGFEEVRQVQAEYTNEQVQQKQNRGLQQPKAAESANKKVPVSMLKHGKNLFMK